MATVKKCDSCGKEFTPNYGVKVSIFIGFCRDYPELKIQDMCEECAISLKNWYEKQRIRNGQIPFPEIIKGGK